MKYCFFDIECCDGEHLCSFGYVIINANFKIVEKKDIVINPEHKFELGRAGFDSRVNLAYPEDFFYKQAPFPFFYNDIKKLFNDSRLVLLGHSIAADLKYIRRVCKRYNLGQIKVEAFDTQDIYSKFKHDRQTRSLKYIVKDLNINVANLCEHKSCDDAEMSMLVIKEICSKLNKNINELLQVSNSCKRYSGFNKEAKNYLPHKNHKSKFPCLMPNFENALAEKGITYEEYIKSLKK